MRPKNLSGEGTVSDAGMWSTSSVEMRGSCRYSLMSRVYSSSSFCGFGAAAVCAGGGRGRALFFLRLGVGRGSIYQSEREQQAPAEGRAEIHLVVLPWMRRVYNKWARG